MFENHKQWSTVKEVCTRLRANGHAALLAGGCVRDMILSREPHDFDIATDAKPDQVERLFPSALTVGRAFGVTILPYGDFQLEIATFRRDLEYKDGRHPEGVAFSGPEDDARRRDFTINALFYDLESNQVIDFVGGQEDIKRKLIRAVGRAETRFMEDKLRILRAVRFAAQLDFVIVPETLEAVVSLAPEVNVVSRERIRDEMMKLLQAPARVRGLELMFTTGLAKALFPDLASRIFEDETRWLRLFGRLKSREPLLSLAVFFSPVYDAKQSAKFRETFLKGLRLDSKQIDAILFALAHASDFQRPQSLREGELILLLAHPSAEPARMLANLFDEDRGQDPSARDRALVALSERVLGPDRKKPEPLLGGSDAKAVGLKPGPEMGRMLNEAYLLQLEGKLANKAQALVWLKNQEA